MTTEDPAGGNPYLYDLGLTAYNAYCESTGGVSVITGEKLPDFVDMKFEVIVAWINAAHAVANKVNRHLPPAEVR